MDKIKALVERIDALEKRATPGPWAWDQRGEKINEWGLGVALDANDNPLIGRFDAEDATYVEQVCQTEGATVNYADADLICTLRNAWPDLKAALAPLAEPVGMPVEPPGYPLLLSFSVGSDGRAVAEYAKALRAELARVTARAEASERDAKRYRWLRDTADLRFDCGGWVIGFENWLKAQGDFPRTPDDEPVSCEPLIVDAAIDTALDAAGKEKP